MPPTFRIFVKRKRFLKKWLSSMNSRSTPSSSKVTTSSLRLWSLSFLSFNSSVLRLFSSCFMVKFSLRLAFASAMLLRIVSICSSRMAFWRSTDSGIFSNWLCPIMTASNSPVAMRPQNFLRFLVSKSFRVETRMFAAG
ncbi:hypothetical protein SDC9_134693 [bioreactor metagenome]|uniref:Uncharacterized protein n=1 Tax=bioreactor metagenome TaxID=1076179 RepID=A0A645DFI4_9ZZZZ